MGLEALSCNPWEAPAGSILVIKGNGVMRMSVEHGDISVVEGVEGGVIVCYNDGRMRLSASPAKWAAGGEYAGALVAIYKPKARA